jgi:hypothetical protein
VWGNKSYRFSFYFCSQLNGTLTYLYWVSSRNQNLLEEPSNLLVEYYLYYTRCCFIHGAACIADNAAHFKVHGTAVWKSVCTRLWKGLQSKTLKLRIKNGLGGGITYFGCAHELFHLQRKKFVYILGQPTFPCPFSIHSPFMALIFSSVHALLKLKMCTLLAHKFFHLNHEHCSHRFISIQEPHTYVRG